jgi:MoaA/NifB/PqqE/SkfB family radical SAM enzyme
LSIVGGDPLVRYRELGVLLPALECRGVHVQLVTSAFRPLPADWSKLPHLNIVVSVDGLQPEHDARRSPATYARVLANIAGHRVSVHWTVTAQTVRRPSYIREFMDFWTPRSEAKRVWVSLFTPQKGEQVAETLTPQQRRFVIEELQRIRPEYPKLDMTEDIIGELAHPPQSPKECVFARATETISADLKTRVTPCQFGGTPDCAQCGCIASMGLAHVGHIRLAPGMSLGQIFAWSNAFGGFVKQGRLKLRIAKWQLSSMRSRACSRSSPQLNSKLPA